MGKRSVPTGVRFWIMDLSDVNRRFELMDTLKKIYERVMYNPSKTIIGDTPTVQWKEKRIRLTVQSQEFPLLKILDICRIPLER